MKTRSAVLLEEGAFRIYEENAQKFRPLQNTWGIIYQGQEMEPVVSRSER